VTKPEQPHIPFEPSSKTRKQKPPQREAIAKDKPKVSPKSAGTNPKVPNAQIPRSKPSRSGNLESKNTATTIPPEVNKRMVRRAAWFCGIPTSLGFGTFIVSYAIAVNHWVELPNSAVVLVSMGFMGLGVLGLSYGALSASWDENRDGNWWGWQEFKQNFGYVTADWKQKKAEKLSSQKSD